jgi:hypothetical protein
MPLHFNQKCALLYRAVRLHVGRNPERTQHMEPVAAKIHRACIDPPGKDNRNDYNSEWAEVKTEGPANLNNFVLEHLVNPQTAGRAWAPYYVFGPNDNFAGPAIIRVHSGHGQPNITQDANGVQTHHRYVADGAEKGQWRLNDTGDVLRLVSPNGTVITERAFAEGHCDSGTSATKPQEKPQTQYA